jgi:hypothetical protein
VDQHAVMMAEPVGQDFRTGRRRVSLLVPDGVGVRNFVLGRFLEEAGCDWSIDVLHTIPDEQLPAYISRWNGVVDSWQQLPPFCERPLGFTLRSCLAYAQMYWVDTFPMRKNRNKPISGSWKTQASRWLAKIVGRMCASPARMSRLERLHTWAVGGYPEVDWFRELFRRSRPDVVFCSHQRPPSVLAPVLAARSLGIPTAAFIFSWDNISTKGRIAAPFDHFLVWSEHMREEMRRYYPDVAPQRVHVVGTPQFDPYRDARLLLTRDEFFRQIGADPGRKLICYSGGAAGNSPDEPRQLDVLLQQVRTGQIRGNPQVVLRPSPADEGSRFREVRARYPELIYCPPAWIHQADAAWDTAMPLPEDIGLLVNLTRHSDLNINFASTMTLDFALHGKPVVNVAFDMSDPGVYGIPQYDYVAQFEHYQPVIELGAARFAKTPEELAAHVNAYLENPELDAAGRARFVELEIGVPVGQCTGRILAVLEQLAEQASVRTR